MAKRVALLSPSHEPGSMAVVLAERLTRGWPEGGAWRRPDFEVTARGGELGTALHGVDAVLVVGEADALTGRPRDLAAAPALFQRCAEALEKQGRMPAVYVGPGLGPDLEVAQRTLATAARLKLPLFSSTTLPLGPRLPETEARRGKVDEVLLAGPGGGDGLDPGPVEALLALVEHRPGGERGIAGVRLIEGDEVWKAGTAGRWSRRLLAAALSRSDDLLGFAREDGRPHDMLAGGELERRASRPVAFLIEHEGGLRSTLLLLEGAVGGHTFGLRAGGRVESGHLLVPLPLSAVTLAPLASAIEAFVARGVPPVSPTRALLAAGILEAARKSRAASARVATPGLRPAR